MAFGPIDRRKAKISLRKIDGWSTPHKSGTKVNIMIFRTFEGKVMNLCVERFGLDQISKAVALF